MTEFDLNLMKLVESALHESQCAMQSVKKCYQNDARTDEDLTSFLVRKGALKPDALRTLGMISKGYLRIPASTVIDRPNLQALITTRHDKSQNGSTPKPYSHLSYLPENQSQSSNKSRIGTQLGRCTISRVLGEGGGGTVYEGLHKGLGIPVAVKVIKDGQRGASIRRALQSEARLLAHLDHPNIVRVYDFDDDSDVPFLVMELIRGQSISDLLKQVGRLNSEMASGVIAQTARGLEAARNLGVIHRDVKPSNILLAKNGVVKIADLGLAVASNAQIQHECGVNGTQDAGTGGTFAYMAPERFSGRGNIEFYSDIYSLGVSFFEMVTGELPYRGTTPFEFMVAHVSNPIPKAHDVCPDVPKALSAVIEKMMAKEPNQRYGNYSDLIADLIRICNPMKKGNCSTWNSMWDGITLEISGVISQTRLTDSTKK